MFLMRLNRCGRHPLSLTPWVVAVATMAVLLAAWPAHGATSNPAETHWRYKVVAGDNLFNLTYQYLQDGSTWKKLQRLNRVTNPYRLRVGSELLIPWAWMRSELTTVQVVHVRGQALGLRAGTEAFPLVPGSTLRMGESLRTGIESAVTLRLVDGSLVLVWPQTDISLQTLLLYGRDRTPHSQFMLLQGAIETQVQPRPRALRRFEIKTPTATLGARGTAFRVRSGSESSDTFLEVTEGKVSADPNEATVVAAGYGLRLPEDGSATVPQALLAPPALPNETVLLDRLPLRIQWPAVAGANGYRAQVRDANDTGGLLLEGQFPNNQARWADLPDGRYQLRVRAVDSSGLEGQDAVRTLVVKARPEPPVVVAPRAEAKVYGDRTTFQWASVSGVTGYRLQVSTDGNFNAPLTDKELGAESTSELPLAPGSYQWRVASIKPGGDQGPFGDATPFEQRAIPASPSAAPPQLDGKQLTLSWRALEPGQQVEVQLARDTDFQQLVVTERTGAKSLTLATPPPGRYHVRLRTLDADGFAGPFGATQQIDIPRSYGWLVVPALLLLLAL